jgi:PAS domain S-box-containing protein
MAEAPHLIVYASPAWCRVCGYTAEEARGRSARMLQGALTDQDAVARFMVKVRRRHCCSMEVVNYTKGGMPFSNYLTAYPLTTDGRVTHYLSTIKPSALVTPASAAVAAAVGGPVVATAVGVGALSSSSVSTAAGQLTGVHVVPSAQGGDVTGSSAAVQQQAAAVSSVLPLQQQVQQLLPLPQHQPAALGLAPLPVLTQQQALSMTAAAAGVGGSTAAVAGMTGFRRRKVDLSAAASSTWQ